MHPIVLGFLHWYGVMMALAFLAGYWTASRRAPRSNLAPEKIESLMPWLIVGAILGARILYVATYWQESFADQPLVEIFMIWHGGLVYYGGLIGAGLGAMFFSRRQKIPPWKIADVLAPSIALGSVFGRIGCLLNGCCYGRACNLPWAITYPVGHETHPAGEPAVPVHPTQIYDALLNLILYFALAWLYRRKKFDGQVFATYLMCYAVTRSFVEFFRGDYDAAHRHGDLTPAHLVGVAIFGAGVALYSWQRRALRPAKSAA